MLYTKSQQILCGKRVSMLTDLKVSSLACKYVFYRPDHNANGGSHRPESSVSSNADRAQIVG